MKTRASVGDLVAMAATGSASGGALVGFGFGIMVLINSGSLNASFGAIYLLLIGTVIGLFSGFLPGILIGAAINRLLGLGRWQSALAGFASASVVLIVFSWPQLPTFDAETILIIGIFWLVGILGGLLAWRLVIRDKEAERAPA